MDQKRVDTLLEFLEASPQDCFVRYGLAQEYVKAGRFDDAIAEFTRILEIDPAYQAAYYHAGKTYEQIGKLDDARAVYQRGVEAADRSGDLHARSEIVTALAELG